MTSYLKTMAAARRLWTEGYVFLASTVSYDHLVLSHGDHIDDD